MEKVTTIVYPKEFFVNYKKEKRMPFLIVVLYLLDLSVCCF